MVGLLHFLWGFINFYIIGLHTGEYERFEWGRIAFLKASIWLFIGAAMYALVLGINWVAVQVSVNGEAGAGVDQSQGVLELPDVDRLYNDVEEE